MQFVRHIAIIGYLLALVSYPAPSCCGGTGMADAHARCKLPTSQTYTQHPCCSATVCDAPQGRDAVQPTNIAIHSCHGCAALSAATFMPVTTVVTAPIPPPSPPSPTLSSLRTIVLLV